MPIPATAAEVDAHQQLLDTLDIFPLEKPFRNPSWKPATRRNKNIKQILTEASRREAASLAATQNNSGASTPAVPSSTQSNGAAANAGPGHNIAQAAQSLSSMVLERNMLNASAAATATAGRGVTGTVDPAATTAAAAAAVLPTSSGPAATYSNIESAPSLHPAHQRRYCDITGLQAPYTDPKTRLRYHNTEVFAVVRGLGQGVAEQYLEARGAHVVLK
ncbi:MAG: hypothetical protein M1825_002182 [Sarcosagium campestre]|nr:MAG: hypothetical protein M1825_002182 [Sarcosagium campestre]